MSEKEFRKPKSGMMHLICNGSRFGLDLQDHCMIVNLLDEDTISSIEKNEQKYVFETYAKVFDNAKPYDSGFCERVKTKLENKDEMQRLNIDMRKKYYSY